MHLIKLHKSLKNLTFNSLGSDCQMYSSIIFNFNKYTPSVLKEFFIKTA